MSVLTAAVVPSAPLLVPSLAGGSAALDEALRATVGRCVDICLGGTGPVVVVASAPRTGAYRGTWDWSGFGVPERGPSGARLPLGLAVGAWLLDQVDPALPRAYEGISDQADTAVCQRRGAELPPGDLRLLVVGDGSARRGEKAPGHLDPRAEPFDRAAEQALAQGAPSALLQMSADEGRELLAAGRAPWQVLAGVADGATVRAELLHADAPYGVGYLVASWVVQR